MRQAIVIGFGLALLAAGASHVDAGKLSRARDAVRGAARQRDDQRPESDKRRGDRDSEAPKDDAPPEGRLSRARQTVRPKPVQASRIAHRRRPAYLHDPNWYDPYYAIGFGGAWGGYSAAVRSAAYPPAPPYPGEPYVPAYVDSPPIERCEVHYAVESFAPGFAEYPYADGAGGYLISEPMTFARAWSGRCHFELGSNFDGLDRRGAGLILEGVGGWGIDFDWDSYREDLDDGQYDELHLGDVNLLYRVAESENLLVRIGVGVDWLGDAIETDFGLNFTLKADYMPWQPLILSGEVDFGTLGDAEMVHGAASIGVLLNRFEFYGGYDYRDIGGVEIEGPSAGMRIWF